MKRKIVLFLMAAVLMMALAMPAFANEDRIETAEPLPESATLSEDLQQMEIDGKIYLRFNATQLASDYSYSDVIYTIIPVQLTEEQKTTIASAGVDQYMYGGLVLKVTVRYTDGAQLEIAFIQQEYLAEYEALTEQTTYTIQFWYPENNTITVENTALRGKEEILFDSDPYDYQFSIRAVSEHGLKINKGVLLVVDDQYYYFDYAENGTTNIYEPERARVWLITDEALLTDIEAAMEAYYGSDIGWLENDDVTSQVSGVLLIFLFVFLPAVVLVLFLVLAIRAKTPVYRKLFWNLCAWAALVLIVVGTVALVVHLA